MSGIILVHDLSNVKSYMNLWKWLTEVLTHVQSSDSKEFSFEEDLTIDASPDGFLSLSDILYPTAKC